MTQEPFDYGIVKRKCFRLFARQTPIVLSDAPSEPSKPLSITPAQEKVTRPAPKPAPVVASAPRPAAPPVPRVVPAAMSEAPVKSGPALVSCQTQNEPGQRVRMECIPVD